MMESDLQTLFKISEVSKYWNYLSKIDLVRDTVYKKEGSFRVTKEEFERDQQLPSANFLRYEDVRWLRYDREKYPPEWLVQDQHLSLKLNKKIIDAAPQSLYDFGKALGVIHNAPTMGAQANALVQKYLVKMRLKAVARTMNFDHWKFQGESEQEIMYIQNNQVKPEWKFIKDTEVEIIGDFIDVVQNGIWFRKVHSYRVLDNRTLIAGMMPINTYLGILVFLLLAPCVLLDLWSLPSTVQYVLKYGFSVTALGSIFIFVAHIFWIAKRPERTKECIYYIAGFSAVLACGIIFTPWNVSLKIGLFIGALHMTTIYFVNAQRYITRSYHKHAVAIFGYIGIMILFVVDWKTMSESFKDGTIRTAALYNSLIYMGFLVFLMALATTRNAIAWRQTATWNWRRAIKLDKPLYIYMILTVAAVIGITLSAPRMYNDM
jgi:hypothetical protein